MTAAYLDSSVLLRALFHQPGALAFAEFAPAFSSRLLVLECRRALDRVRLRERLDEGALASLDADIVAALRLLSFVPLDEPVLARAALPLAVPLATLDAIHLASALIYREAYGAELVFATHDGALASAARLYGFAVIGA